MDEAPEDLSLSSDLFPSERRRCYCVPSVIGNKTSQDREDALWAFYADKDNPDSDKVFANLIRLYPLEEYERPVMGYSSGAVIFTLNIDEGVHGDEEFFEYIVPQMERVFRDRSSQTSTEEANGEEEDGPITREFDYLADLYAKPHSPYHFKRFETEEEARQYILNYLTFEEEERLRKFMNAENAREDLKEIEHEELRQAFIYAKYTEGGASERLVALHGRNLKYDHYGKGRWLIWNGSYWRPDDTKQIKRFGRDLVQLLYEYEKELPGGNESERNLKKALKKFAKKCDTNNSIEAIIRLAAAYEGIAINGHDVLDKELEIVGLPDEKGEVLDLKTCQPRSASKSDLVTMTLGFYPSENEDCPVFKAFLSRACGGKERLISFIKRAIGYSLTGDPKEHKFFLLWGDGRNGKSTFLGIMREVFGNYARHADMATWQYDSKKEGQTRSDLVRLEKARLVTSIEAGKRFRFNMTIIQGVTGGDPLTMRTLYQEEFEYMPMFSLWLAANYRPEITEKTTAAWERVMPVPWNVFIPSKERDKELPAKLRAEGPGITRWVLNGLLDYRREGLNPPLEVLDFLGEYKTENDSLALFARDMIVLETDAIVGAEELKQYYHVYCEQEAITPIADKEFPSEFIRLGLKGVQRMTRSNAGQRWKGLRVKKQKDFDREEKGEKPIASGLV